MNDTSVSCFILSKTETKKIQVVKFDTNQECTINSWKVYLCKVVDPMVYAASLRKKGYNKIYIQDADSHSESFEKNGLYHSLFKNIPIPWLKFLLENEKHILQISQDLEFLAIKKKVIFPKVENVFRIFKMIDPKDIKIIMIGQDPYPQKNIADGISFSTNQENPIPPSLRNIFKELKDFEHIDVDDKNPDLTRWVKQGCLLINSAWTVQENEIGIHIDLWKVFVHKLIQFVYNEVNDVLCVFFGSEAKRKFKLIIPEERSYLVVHPSPNSCEKGFYNSQIFSRLNEHLIKLGKEKIDWR